LFGWGDFSGLGFTGERLMERFFSVPEAVVEFERRGVQVSRATVVRWMSCGVGGRKLARRRIGGRWYVTEAAIVEWLAYTGGGSPVGAAGVEVVVERAGGECEGATPRRWRRAASRDIAEAIRLGY
jgi:hypothetical protein